MKALKGLLAVALLLFGQAWAEPLAEGAVFLNGAINACHTQEDAEEVARLPFPDTLQLLKEKQDEEKCGMYVGVFLVMERVAKYGNRYVYRISVPEGFLYGLAAEPSQGVGV